MLKSIRVTVTSVTLGTIGGFVFTGKPINTKSKKLLVCKVHRKIASHPPSVGEIFEFDGDIIQEEQFKRLVDIKHCTNVNIAHIDDAELLEWHLLKHHEFRGFGLGKSKVKKLIKDIGAYSLIKLLNEGRYNHISEVVNENIARNLTKNWGKLQNKYNTFEVLNKYGIPISIAQKLLKLCQHKTVERIHANPYMLVPFSDLVPNIWKHCENIAKNQNIKSNDKRRLIGAVELELYQMLEQGHTCCPHSKMHNRLEQRVSEALINEAIKLSIQDKYICHKSINDEKNYQLSGIGYLEYQVERHLQELANTPKTKDLFTTDTMTSLIEYNIFFYETNDYYLTESQLNAARSCLENRLCVIDGFGGTGKTTILKAVIDIAKKSESVYVLALSGKAASRARESVGINEICMTIHSFIMKIHDLDISNKLRIVIDEAAMVDILLMNKLLKALSSLGVVYSIIMLGDEGQLPPVGFGLCFHRLVNMASHGNFESLKLTEVHRTKSTNQLHTVAMSIRKGEMPELCKWDGEREGVFMLPCTYEDELHKTLFKVHKETNNSQILTAHITDKRKDSATKINKYIQSELKFNHEYMPLGTAKISMGDKVIVTQNHYELDLYNGNVGKVLSVSAEGEEYSCDIDFEGNQLAITKSTAWELGLQLAYAVSVHKSQGSEYDTAIVCALENSILLDRSMIYTAITRAKKLTILVGNWNVVNKAVIDGNRADHLHTLLEVNFD
jgi:exodeoxyribonuclease V alpha subunit